MARQEIGTVKATPSTASAMERNCQELLIIIDNYQCLRTTRTQAKQDFSRWVIKTLLGLQPLTLPPSPFRYRYCKQVSSASISSMFLASCQLGSAYPFHLTRYSNLQGLPRSLFRAVLLFRIFSTWYSSSPSTIISSGYTSSYFWLGNGSVDTRYKRLTLNTLCPSPRVSNR